MCESHPKPYFSVRLDTLTEKDVVVQLDSGEERRVTYVRTHEHGLLLDTAALLFITRQGRAVPGMATIDTRNGFVTDISKPLRRRHVSVRFAEAS